MVSFRKLVMAMLLLVIVAGLAMAQSATAPIVSCSTYNQQTARLRSEGVTELIPELTLVCMSANQLPNQPAPPATGPIASGTLYDWFVYFPANAPLTSSPEGAGKDVTEPQLAVQVVPVIGGTPGAPETINPGTADPTILVTYAAAITAGNASSGGSVMFKQVDMNPLGDHRVFTGPTSDWNNVYITITGLRVDALGLASTGPLVTPNALTLTLFAQPSQTTNSANQQNPGNVFLPPINGVQQYTLAVSVGYSAPSLTVTETGTFRWRQCFSWSSNFGPQSLGEIVAANAGGGGSGPTGQNNFQALGVNFTELYSYAFAPPTDGWEDPAHGGIRLAFVFSTNGDNAWPSFVRMAVPVAVRVWDPTHGTVVQANLVTGTNPDGSGGTVQGYSGGFAPNYLFLGSDAAPGAQFSEAAYEITGASMVVYEIAVVPPALPAVTTTLQVPIIAMIEGTPTPYPPPDDPSAEVTIVRAGFAPWTPASVPQPSPIPRFHMPPPFNGNNLLEVVSCTTSLLYPYIVAGQGWDTGVTVANGGLDPFGEFNPRGNNTSVPAVPGTSSNGNEQPGICNFYFYGSFDRGAPLVTADTNPPNPVYFGAGGFGSGSATGDDPANYIQPGTTSEDLVMAVLALNNPAVDLTKHSWNGYAIAQCDFLYAHGYAFTVFQDPKRGNLSLGYLALVFDQRGIEHPSQRPEKMTF